MRRRDAYVRSLRSACVLCAIGFAWPWFALAGEPADPPVPSSTGQEENATPPEAGEVQTRAARGSANSKTRADWCSDHLIACYAAGDAYCKGHYSDAASLKICNDSVTDSCGKSWGPASTCMTDKIVAGGSAGLPPTVVAPSVNAAPLAPNQQLQLLQQQQLRRRGVEPESPATPPSGEQVPSPK
jgi:hypothetical protein